MRKFPFYRQQYQMDCGAACVKMLCLFYGIDYSIQSIRDMCRVGIEGSSLKGICDALDTIGFKTAAGRITYDDITEKAVLPCILHWGQNHFVVLYQVRKKGRNYSFLIADPDGGLVEYNRREFCNRWISTRSQGEDKGVALLAEPDLFHDYSSRMHSSEDQQSQKRNKISFLWGYFSRYQKYFIGLLSGIIICSLIVLILPFLTQSIVDIGVGFHSLKFVILILLGQMVLLFGKTFIDFIETRLLLHIGARINLSLLSDFFIKLMKLPMSFFDTRLSGDILQRIEDHKRINSLLTEQVIGLSFSLLTFTAFSIVLFIYSRIIFLIFILFSVVYGLWLFLFLSRRRKLDYKLFEQQAQNQSKTFQLIESMQETKVHNAERKMRWEWEDIQANLFETNLDILRMQQTQNAGGVFINELRNTIIVVMAASSVIGGEYSLGVMVAIQFISGQLSYPIEKIMNFIYKWQDANISLDRIQAIYSQSDENVNRTVSDIQGSESISFSNVSFRYPGIREEYVLKDVSFTVPSGKTTAIVGSSGSGKTTILKLLLGYYLPTQGTIFVDNISLSTLNQDWWRSQCGVVVQDGYIYSDTIASNIAISDDDIDLEKLKYASLISRVNEFVEGLPLKFNTKIGEGGQGLSQGQKQRILIARAIYQNPKFLILDEATNSLDANTERTIVQELESFYEDKTVLIVAHRLSTVKKADNIIVLDHGEIVEEGTHENLISLKGFYYQLIKNQLELDV